MAPTPNRPLSRPGSRERLGKPQVNRSVLVAKANAPSGFSGPQRHAVDHRAVPLDDLGESLRIAPLNEGRQQFGIRQHGHGEGCL